MAKARGKTIPQIAEQLGEPIAERLGLKFWDVKFEKEGSVRFLRYFLYKEGGVDIEDCENFSRLMDAELDRVDPIEESYYLEAASPGIECELTKAWHFELYLGKLVSVKLFKAKDGQKEFVARLTNFDESAKTVTLCFDQTGSQISFALAEAVYVKLFYDFDARD